MLSRQPLPPRLLDGQWSVVRSDGCHGDGHYGNGHLFLASGYLRTLWSLICSLCEVIAKFSVCCLLYVSSILWLIHCHILCWSGGLWYVLPCTLIYFTFALTIYLNLSTAHYSLTSAKSWPKTSIIQWYILTFVWYILTFRLIYLNMCFDIS